MNLYDSVILSEAEGPCVRSRLEITEECPVLGLPSFGGTGAGTSAAIDPR